MSTAVSAGGSAGGGGGAGGAGGGNGGRRPGFDPHGKHHKNAGPCPRCQYNVPGGHRLHIMHRMKQNCAHCRAEFTCRFRLAYHLWFDHEDRTTTTASEVPYPGDHDVQVCACQCAWSYERDYEHMHDHQCQ